VRIIHGDYEIDDDPVRVDRDAVWAFLAGAYWNRSRTRAQFERQLDGAWRVVAAYSDSAASDSAPFDSAPFDSAPFDSAPFDSAPFDSAPFDSAPFDSAPFDSAPAISASLRGFARAVSDGVSIAYLADVFVLPEARGQGLGTALVTAMIEGGPGSGMRWMLHTLDAHGLYARFGFAAPGDRYLERPAGFRPA
jgi:GNAT superfamily N-acetyltransferase